MLAQLLSLVLVNTYTWFGGQGYCAYDFALTEQAAEYHDVEITLRPQFDPNDTASGNTELPDETITLDVIGGAAVDSQQVAKVETDCNIKGLTIVKATATSDGRPVDLLQENAISLDAYQPVQLNLGSKQ